MPLWGILQALQQILRLDFMLVNILVLLIVNFQQFTLICRLKIII